MSGHIDTIVWDLGGVLVDWSPTYVYDQRYFDNPADRDYFFTHICTQDWNEQQDAGYSLQKATEEKLAEFPAAKWQQPIRDFYGRWIEMLRGPLPDTVVIFRGLKESQQFKFFALTNWSAENFHIALARFDFCIGLTAVWSAGRKELVNLSLSFINYYSPAIRSTLLLPFS